MDCGTAGGEGTESDSIITHSDSWPADVPAVKCVPYRQLQCCYVTQKTKLTMTDHDKVLVSALGDSKKHSADKIYDLNYGSAENRHIIYTVNQPDSENTYS